MSDIFWNVSPVRNSPCLSWNSIYNFVSAIALAECKDVWMFCSCAEHSNYQVCVALKFLIESQIESPLHRNIFWLFLWRWWQIGIYIIDRDAYLYQFDFWNSIIKKWKIHSVYVRGNKYLIILKKIIINSFCCWNSFFLLASDPTM